MVGVGRLFDVPVRSAPGGVGEDGAEAMARSPAREDRRARSVDMLTPGTTDGRARVARGQMAPEWLSLGVGGDTARVEMVRNGKEREGK